MQSENRIMAVMALALLASVMILAASPADADQEYTKDYGEFYSYTLQFVFDGAEAQTIDWDFGDGSEHSGDWNPRHNYADKGTYYVTQTTTNPKGTTTEVYRVQIMGYPVVAFDSNGGSAIQSIQMDSYDSPIAQPTDPVKEGYEFDGWFYEPTFDNPVDWSIGITKTMTLYAKWVSEELPVIEFTVTFDSNGGSSIPSQTVESGQSASRPADPVRPGYTFKGWLSGSTAYDFASPVMSDLILKASWQQDAAPIVNRIVSFNVDGGSSTVSGMTVSDGSRITLPAYNGSKSGFAFGGWSYANVTYQPGQTYAVTSDVTFKAVWKSTAPVVSDIIITFDVDGGSKTIPSKTVKSGSEFVLPAYDGTKKDCTFGGWACGFKVYQPGQSVTLTGDVTVKAIWNAADQGKDDVDKDKDAIDQIVGFVKDNLYLIIVILVLLVLMILYLRSRRY